MRHSKTGMLVASMSMMAMASVSVGKSSQEKAEPKPDPVEAKPADKITRQQRRAAERAAYKRLPA